MSKNSQVVTEVELEEEELVVEEMELDSQDYGFIISADGELKHLFTPDEFYLDPPPLVKKILKLLGIKDINTVATDDCSDTLH
jgi:hypothetical protein